MRALTLRAHRPDVAAALHDAHGCHEGCLACLLLREDEDDQRPGLLHPWQRYVNSETAMRHAGNAIERGIPFPTLSPDPLVQYVVQESVYERYTMEKQKLSEQVRTEQEQAAKVAEAKRRLEAAG